MAHQKQPKNGDNSFGDAAKVLLTFFAVFDVSLRR